MKCLESGTSYAEQFSEDGPASQTVSGVIKMTKISGSCLCGAIRYQGDVDIKMIINCHCDDCRRATGSVHGTMIFVPEDSLEISGSPKGFDHAADSGSTLTKLFCENCGSQVFGKNTSREGVIGIRAGTLDQKELIKPGMNLFKSSAIASTPMDPDIKVFDKMPS